MPPGERNVARGPPLALVPIMRNALAACIVVALLGLPIHANALETDELIALTAMPLVVAAAAELTDVPTGELMNVVSTLNNAAVPPTQFVEVVRYAPVALVASTEPRFTTYVTTEYGRGITGEPLALAIAEQYPAYGVEEIRIVDPPVMTYVQRQTLLPEVVVTRFEPQPFDALALVAMPLAVAAVSEVSGVPTNDLIDFITALNRARMPAPQFVEVVRYSPVMLVGDDRPAFIRYVTTEIDRGVVGRPLAFALADRIGIDDIDRPRVIIDDDVDAVLLPPVVARAHPHGGPPGQLKKQLGLQTGAEVVHGTRRGRPADRTVRVDDDRAARAPKKVRPNRGSDRDEPRVTKRGRGNSGKAPKARASNRDDDGPGKARVSGGGKARGNGGSKARGGGGGKGNSGEGKGKGKGKGKG